MRDDILVMGSMVDEELTLALEALNKMDVNLAHQVYEADKAVNAKRFAIEEQCFTLIVTQQPAARDLRAIVAVMNMIVDLERMGDQAKGIAKVIPHMMEYPDQSKPAELKQMGEMVGSMLRQSMTAYAQYDVELARHVTTLDDDVDRLYAQLFNQIVHRMADTGSPEKVEASYEVLRAGRELERYGDLATNIAERVIYIATGSLHEANVDPDDILDAYLDQDAVDSSEDVDSSEADDL
jgi:phosphate transport system protein